MRALLCQSSFLLVLNRICLRSNTQKGMDILVTSEGKVTSFPLPIGKTAIPLYISNLSLYLWKGPFLPYLMKYIVSSSYPCTNQALAHFLYRVVYLRNARPLILMITKSYNLLAIYCILPYLKGTNVNSDHDRGEDNGRLEEITAKQVSVLCVLPV